MGDYSNNPGLRTVFVDKRPTSRQLRKAKLVVVEGPDRGKEILIGKTKVFVGRSSVNDLPLDDKSISGTHFELSACEEGYLLRDMGSTNGVTFAGLRVREIYLKPGSTFKAGNSTFKFFHSDDIVEIPLSTDDRFGTVLGQSIPMREIFSTLEKVSPSDLTVLIEGETGTGKEMVARSIHQLSRRKKRPFVVLDCSSIPRDLVESTVFGHEKGSFTGAVNQHKGAFEQANGGTIFMDEIGELDINLQPKLLRVLENRELKRVGGDKTVRVDVRVVAATNRDLRKMVTEGTFREDLYFRLSVIQLGLPPLRDRKDDFPLLIDHFLELFAAKRDDNMKLSVSRDAMKLVYQHTWPGNVRELKNVLERAVSLCDSDVIQRPDLQLRPSIFDAASSKTPSFGAPSFSPPSQRPSPASLLSTEDDDPDVSNFSVALDQSYKEAKQVVLDQFEHAYVARIFKNHNGNISQAAKSAGLTRYHLRELLKKHNVLNR